MSRRIVILMLAVAVAMPVAAGARPTSAPVRDVVRALMPPIGQAVMDAPMEGGRLARDAAAGFLDADASAGALLRRQSDYHGERALGAPALTATDPAAALSRLFAIAGARPDDRALAALARMDARVAGAVAGIADAIASSFAERAAAWRAVTPETLAAIRAGTRELRPVAPAPEMSLLHGITRADVDAFAARRGLIDTIDHGATLRGATIIADEIDAARASLHGLSITAAAGTPALLTIPTPLGDIVVKGSGADDNDEDALLLIDLGGNDRYLAKAASAIGDPNPLLAYTFAAVAGLPGAPPPPPPSAIAAALKTRIVLDLGGADLYGSALDGNQGYGEAGGVGILVDAGGNDIYRGADGTQGAGFLGGVGVLVDAGGTNTYLADIKSQGFSQTGGVGLLASGTGADTYDAFVFSQGTGFDGGAGASLIDAGGNDRYRCNGEVDAADVVLPVSQSRPSTGCHGTGFGGQGLLVDGGGDDLYYVKTSFQTMALIGSGVLVDSGGTDVFDAGEWSNGMGALGVAVLAEGSGATTYGSVQRTDPLSAWVDVYLGANGEGYVAGVGVLSDAGGNDVYSASADKARWMAQFSCSAGCAFTEAVGVLDDAGGNDRYTSEVGQGAALGGYAAFVDASGDDTYTLIAGSIRGQGFADPNPIPTNGLGLLQCGIAYLIDADGIDSYSNPVTATGTRTNGSWWTSGSYGRGADGRTGVAAYAQAQLLTDIGIYVTRQLCTV